MARPALLWGGAVLAGLPLLLHFLRPRERSRRVLPTLRFLTPDPRTRVRLRRRPDEILLLALRMGLCLLLGAAFAGAAWIGPSEGTGVLVVVDGGFGMAGAWDEAREAVRAAAGEEGARLVEVAVVRPGRDGVPGVTRFGPGEVPDDEEWSALAPEEGETQSEDVRLGHLIRALRDGAERVTGVDSLQARIVTIPRWSAWGPGTTELRDELWPATIELVVPGAGATQPGLPPGTEPAGGEAADPAMEVRRVVVSLEAPPEMRARIEAALGAIGVTPAEVEAPDAPDAPGAASSTLRVHLQAGPEHESGRPWIPGEVESPAPGADAFLLLDGRSLPGAGSRLSGRPDAGARVPVLRAGGRPAAAALPGPDGCRLALPLDPRAPILETGDLALLLEALIGVGCGFPAGLLPPGGAPSLDPAGALEVWHAFLGGEGPSGRAGDEAAPAVLEARPLRGPDAGRSLTRLLLALALGIAVLEVLRVRAVEAGRGPERADAAGGSSAGHRGNGDAAAKETTTKDERE